MVSTGPTTPNGSGPSTCIAEPERVFAPGGESWNGFHDRVDAAMERLGHEHPDATVMTVSHAGVIAASLRVRFGGPSTGAARLVPTNTGMTVWDLDETTHVMDVADLRRRPAPRRPGPPGGCRRRRAFATGVQRVPPRRGRILDRQRHGWPSNVASSPSGSPRSCAAPAATTRRSRSSSAHARRRGADPMRLRFDDLQRLAGPPTNRRSPGSATTTSTPSRTWATASTTAGKPRRSSCRTTTRSSSSRTATTGSKGSAAAGYSDYWAVVGFDDDEQRRLFSDGHRPVT